MIFPAYCTFRCLSVCLYYVRRVYSKVLTFNISDWNTFNNTVIKFISASKSILFSVILSNFSCNYPGKRRKAKFSWANVCDYSWGLRTKPSHSFTDWLQIWLVLTYKNLFFHPNISSRVSENYDLPKINWLTHPCVLRHSHGISVSWFGYSLVEDLPDLSSIVTVKLSKTAWYFNNFADWINLYFAANCTGKPRTLFVDTPGDLPRHL